MHSLTTFLNIPQHTDLVYRFVYEQENPATPLADNNPTPAVPDLEFCKVRVFISAMATFYAPSDISGLGGMRRERIRATPSWRQGFARHDCVFISRDVEEPGLRGLHVGHIRLFFSVKSTSGLYPCTLVEWFSPLSDAPDPDTDMWIVTPDVDARGQRILGVVHIDAIVRAAHLIGVAGSNFTPRQLRHYDTLDAFKAFYVNKSSLLTTIHTSWNSDEWCG